MKKAQRCPHCKECFITEQQLAICPFCEKDIPQKQKQKQKTGLDGISIEELRAALRTLTAKTDGETKDLAEVDKAVESSWISVKDGLPKEKTYVLAIHNRENRVDPDDQQGVSTVVVKLIKGISEKERAQMSDCTRKQKYIRSDEGGNNKRPYCWEQFGADHFFGQVITYWKPIILPGNENKEITLEQSTDVIKEFVTVNDAIIQLYNLVYGFLSKNNELLKSKTLSNEVLCDFGFFSREIAAIFDELRKEANARKDLCGQIIAYRLTQAVLSDPTLKMKTKGQFASGTPDCKMQAALPKKFTDDYYKITDFLGVPRDVAASGVLRLDWKQVTEYLTKRMNEGKPIPEGFGKQYPVYTTTYRKIKARK